MLPDEQELSSVKLQLGLLEKDVEVISNTAEKLSESIIKTQDLNVQLVKMLSLHEQRISQHEKVEVELKEDIKELHSRITTVNREIHERIDQVEHHISSRIDALRLELLAHKNQDKDKYEHPKLSERLAKVEQWQWMAAGAIALLGWLAGHSDFLGKLFN